MCTKQVMHVGAGVGSTHRASTALVERPWVCAKARVPQDEIDFVLSRTTIRSEKSFHKDFDAVYADIKETLKVAGDLNLLLLSDDFSGWHMSDRLKKIVELIEYILPNLRIRVTDELWRLRETLQAAARAA